MIQIKSKSVSEGGDDSKTQRARRGAQARGVATMERRSNGNRGTNWDRTDAVGGDKGNHVRGSKEPGRDARNRQGSKA